MTSADGGCDRSYEVHGWLLAAFAAERAPARCRLPEPATIAASPPRATRVPAVRASFVIMLILSAGALLIHLVQS